MLPADERSSSVLSTSPWVGIPPSPPPHTFHSVVEACVAPRSLLRHGSRNDDAGRYLTPHCTIGAGDAISLLPHNIKNTDSGREYRGSRALLLRTQTPLTKKFNHKTGQDFGHLVVITFSINFFFVQAEWKKVRCRICAASHIYIHCAAQSYFTQHLFKMCPLFSHVTLLGPRLYFPLTWDGPNSRCKYIQSTFLILVLEFWVTPPIIMSRRIWLLILFIRHRTNLTS